MKKSKEAISMKPPLNITQSLILAGKHGVKLAHHEYDFFNPRLNFDFYGDSVIGSMEEVLRKKKEDKEA